MNPFSKRMHVAARVSLRASCEENFVLSIVNEETRVRLVVRDTNAWYSAVAP